MARIGGELHTYRGCKSLKQMKGYIPKTTGTYLKDYSRCTKRGWNMNLLEDVVGMLCRGEKLGRKYHDHKLLGDRVDCRECHIKGDWALIYQLEGKYLILRKNWKS